MQITSKYKKKAIISKNIWNEILFFMYQTIKAENILQYKMSLRM